MAYCTACGHEISDAALSCPKCGQATPRAAAPPPAPHLPAPGAGPADLRPLGIGEIIDVAIKIYLRHFVTMVKLVAIVVVPIQLVSALIQASLIADPFITPTFDPEFDPTQPPVILDVPTIGMFIAATLLTVALGVVAALLATGASLKAVSDAYLGTEPEWHASLRFALARLGPLVWLAIIQTAVLIPAFLACLAPGVWLYVAWSVAVPVLLLEGGRGWGALSRSFSLVRRRWWQTFAVLILGWIISAIVQMIIGGVFGFALPATADSLFVDFFSGAVGGAISSVLVTPFLAAVVAVIYFDLRVRKEGFDLELLAQRVGGEPAEAGPMPPAAPAEEPAEEPSKDVQPRRRPEPPPDDPWQRH